MTIRATRWTYKDRYGKWRYVNCAGELTYYHEEGKSYVMECDYRISSGSIDKRSTLTLADFDALFESAYEPMKR